MSKIILILFLLLLAGCSVKPIETIKTNNNKINVEKLFTHEGCSIYRFQDCGYYRYYVNCKGSVIQSESHPKYSLLQYIPTEIN